MSFRSAPAVLDAVDRVFADPGNRAGVVTGARDLHHRARRGGAGGRVERRRRAGEKRDETTSEHSDDRPTRVTCHEGAG